MTNATATKVAQPIAKLYKRCKWGQHKSCAGHFETYSVCSCDCHAPKAEAPKATKARKAVKTPQVAPLKGMTPLGIVDVTKGKDGSAKALRAAFSH